MTEEVKHYQVNGKYRIVIERAASTKGTLGYKVEANGDDYDSVIGDIAILKLAAEVTAGMPVVEEKK